MHSLPRVEHVPENVPSTAADSVESTHPDREGDSRNVEQSTQAQPEENSVAHDQDEMPSESEAETQVEAPSEENETEPEQIEPLRRTDSIESTHPDREGDNRNVEQSTQAQPEENSVAHDQDEMPSESEAETQEIMDRKSWT
ncbi:hypothetical protein F2Q70_00025072 [Brassica cretica]|uniref:Uncharacterized protein n=1 Tax=Brassica cretica TaxID=69181 RepID=A0A8S9L886_BRACR|nr:hypothetical protein F2Q70_00025072 [Brassica cretica]